jgi:hypothetical protein
MWEPAHISLGASGMAKLRISLAALFALTAPACAAGSPTALEEAEGETGVEGPFDAVPDEVKADGIDSLGPTVTPGADTEVWAVRNQWDERDTPEARRAGVAWGENSGLDWEQKFDRWVASFEVVARSGHGQTFRMRTPFGDRAFDAPTLECAEVAIFLRATFASWYGLPFFLTGWDARSGQPMYAGHFGFVDRRGKPIGGFPNFRTAYADYTSRWRAGQPWPSDARLRSLRLGDDDRIVFLSTDGRVAGAGAYFDEVYLNKRVGYFMRLLLLYFGSVNLSDSANTFHVRAEALAPGDMLIARWQRRGIGHVMPVFRRIDVGDGRFEVAIASGSMPRRQPLWQETAEARSYFMQDACGGPGTNSDGDAYARLGGGLRRWRTPVLSGGRWRNLVRAADRPAFLDDSEVEAIAARTSRFGELLARLTPEQRRDAALARVQAARAHLREFPASCSARARREEAFADLYQVMSEYFGESRAEVDRRYRTLEDYVFGELEYARSRTCCWNRTTAAMREIILSYAEKEQADAAARGMCVEPTVFRAEAADRMAGGDGYGRWRRYAQEIGRGAEWRAWSEDEPCAQRDVVEDTLAGRGSSIPWCARSGGGAATPPTTGCDPEGGDDTVARARPLARGATIDARICASDVDFYRIDAGTAGADVVVRFRHASGDIDIQAVRADGSVIAESAGTSDEERVRATGTFYVRVFGYAGAQNSYSIRVQ